MPPSPIPPAEGVAPTPQDAAAVFDPLRMPVDWPEGSARFAIGGQPARVVFANPSALALFGAKEIAAFNHRLLAGGGPSARRLRHLAATLPIDNAPRLERMHFFVERRPAGVNLRCVRVMTSDGATYLLASALRPGSASLEPAGRAATERAPEPNEPFEPTYVEATPKTRFLWTLDEEGRFGEAHPALTAAVGDNAPRPGEAVQDLVHRVGIEEGDALARVLAERDTFTDFTIHWPLTGVDRRQKIILSAAPIFDRDRRFAGYRGFGLVGEEAAALMPKGEDLPKGGDLPKDEDLAPARAGEAPDDEEAAMFEHAPTPASPGAEPAAESGGQDGAKGNGGEQFPANAETGHVGDAAESNAAIEASDLAGSTAAPFPSPEPASATFAPLGEMALDAQGEIVSVEDEASATGAADDPPSPVEPLADAATSPEDNSPVELDPELGASDESPCPPAAEAATETGSAESSAALADVASADRPSRDASSPVAAHAASDRSAEIYVLRQAGPAPTPANVVPIRPGALDALSARDTAPGASGQSVELSKDERDAFREIARALVGRPFGPIEERTGEVSAINPVGDARDRLDLVFAAPFGPTAGPEAQPAARGGGDDEAVRRNAAAILDRLPIGALVARDARPLYLNQTLLDLLNYRDFAHFRAADGLAAMFRDRDPSSIAPETGAVAIIKADGQSLAVDGHAQAIVWDGAPATLFAFRRAPEAERQIRLHSAERATPMRDVAASDLQTMLDYATDGVVTLDSAGRILSVNQPAERLFGYDEREVAGESALMLLAPQSHSETTAKLENLSRAGEPGPPGRPFQVVGRDRSGGPLALAVTLARIGSAEAPRYCALFRDLSRERETERRVMAARDAAQAASAAKTDFLAQVSHEIRTPLHAILGFAEVMMEERFGPIGNERYRDYLKDIHTSGKHVSSLADDLLDLTKIEAGKLELAFAPVDANSLIRECVSLMHPQASRERIIMRVSLYDRLPLVMVDERSLKQIMLNLISNAVKYNEPGGQVIVSTALDASGQAVIRVRDTGVGMSENEVGLALEPFGQGGRAGRKGGAGLGLPLTKALVEANKAELSIKSRPEQGTLIEIAFPKVQAAQ